MAATLFLCAPVHADMAIQRVPVGNAPAVLLLKGEFTQSDDPQALAREVAATGAKTVTFDSGGGNVVAAMAYGRAVRSLGLMTVQFRAAECASACALAFAGGAVRRAEAGSIGVHQSSFAVESGLDRQAAVTAVQSLTAEIMTYLIEMDVDPRLLQLSLSIPSDDMRYLTMGEMRPYRLISGDFGEEAAQIERSGAVPNAAPTTSPPVARGEERRYETPERKALAFASAYHDAWSLTNDRALSFIDGAYADVVDFYGKATAKAKVLEEKQTFAARWPARAYIVKRGSERAACADTCKVDGVVEWFVRRNVGGRFSSGAARFSLSWDPATGKITSETGEVIEVDKNATTPVRILARWSEENSECRGGSGDRPETLAACERRGATDAKLRSVGWCYGREGESGYQMDWHACAGVAGDAAATVSAATDVGARKPVPSDYPSRGELKGKTSLPDFKNRDRDFNAFRTRIRDGMKQGPNFAGHYSVIQFGCGTGCSGVVVADNRTGQPAWFPRGGEDNMYLDLLFQLDSRLLAAQWLDHEAGRCFTEFVDYDRSKWILLRKVDIGPTEACYRTIEENLRRVQSE
ncbi:hypothetical protein C8J31_11430 [Rhizobium sp. PP-CC-2G-626]|nr:hypothetical protein C8J31_11430 [Rhizobium sp. PP-CC-2G-626]